MTDLSNRKPILCLDFDGVCHSYTSGWKGVDVIPDPPVEGLFEALYQYSEHFEVNIFSSRSTQVGQISGIDAMYAWFEKHCPGITGYLEFPIEKPPAVIGIDDRVLTFTGKWPSVEELKRFQPWNKRDVSGNLQTSGKEWRCFFCDFSTFNTEEAAAHFGDRDDAEEFKPICKWWQALQEDARIATLQEYVRQINYEQAEAYKSEKRAEAAEREAATWKELAQSAWINVIDRLPKLTDGGVGYVPVMFYQAFEDRQYLGYYDPLRSRWLVAHPNQEESPIEVYDVTEWRPWVKSPKEETLSSGRDPANISPQQDAATQR